MRPRRALCVSLDGAVCPRVDCALAAAGLAVEHVAALPPARAAGGGDVALVVVDRGVRRAAGEALRAMPVPVIVVGDDLEDDALVALMLDAPVSHVVEDPCDRTLAVASAQLASGEVRGLEAYLAAGGAVHERVIGGDLDKRRAMDEVCAWAEAAGARRPVVHRVASVVDELLMNALIAAAGGGGGARGEPAARATLRWASDDRTLAVSVVDERGALSRRHVLDHVRRARRERGRPLSAIDGDVPGGAGLGLFLVLANVAGLVVSVTPGQRTEIVCLFDLAPRARRPPARSLHMFASAAR